MPKKAAEGTSFLERSDLVKINKCYHRFHLFCLCHFWFDQLEDDFDDKGNVMFEYIPPKDKLCPVCRREVGSMDYARLILKNKQPFALSEISENIKNQFIQFIIFHCSSSARIWFPFLRNSPISPQDLNSLQLPWAYLLSKFQISWPRMQFFLETILSTRLTFSLVPLLSTLLPFEPGSIFLSPKGHYWSTIWIFNDILWGTGSHAQFPFCTS